MMNEIADDRRRVVCAAIKGFSVARGEILITGSRHFDSVMRAIIEHLGLSGLPNTWKQGFIDQWGEYMSREEAFKVALAAGQIRQKTGNPDSKELFSEDLY